MVLKIRVVTRSGRTGFSSVMADGCYKIMLKAPPVNGKANHELLSWLAKEFSTTRGSIAIISGTSSRTKTVRIMEPSSNPLWYNG